MAGLLDFLGTPQGQGLLGAVAGGMATARRGTPWNNTGRGLLGGVAAYGNALDREQQASQFAAQEQDRAQMREMRDMQMAQTRAQLEQQKAQQAWREGLPGAMEQAQGKTYDVVDTLGDGVYSGQASTPANPKALQDYLQLPASPFADKLLEQKLFPKAADYKVVGNSLVRIGGDGQVSPAYTAPEKPQALPSDVQAYNFARQNDGYQGSFTDWLRQNKKAGASNVNVTTRQETEEAKTVGKFFGEEYGNILKAGTSAQSKLNRYSRLGDLLNGVQTGRFAETGLEVAKAARALGFNVGENIGNLEAAQALSGEIALELRNPSGGAGMPGAMSDADRQFLSNMVPGLQTTPQGRTFMLETARRLAQRDIKVSQMARDYRMRNGSLDEGFYNEIARYAEANPLFSGLNMPQGQGGGASGGWSAKKVN